MRTDEEQVVLLDESGNAVGTADKKTVHHERTPLHLAFSCYLFDPDGSLLLSRRALNKPTWPGVWTNSVCGHPMPGEGIWDAVVRRAGEELGVEATDVQLALPAFRYEAVMPNGVRENEMCPVFVALAADEVRPLPEEVDSVEWVPWQEFSAQVMTGSRRVSPWCVEQVTLLRELPLVDGRPRGSGEPGSLPPAAGGRSGPEDFHAR